MLSISRLALATLALAFASQATAAFNLHADGSAYQNTEQAVGIADVTKDSLDDLLVLLPRNEENQYGMLMVLAQPASSSRALVATHYLSLFQPTGAMKVGDVNNDGFVETVFGTDTGFTLGMTSAPPEPFLYSHQYASGLRCDRIATGDLNADGYMDVVCQNAADGVVAFFNKAYATDAAFQVQKAQPTVGVGADAIALGDVTGDGRPDLVTIDGDDANRSLVLYPNDGKGAFGAGIPLARYGSRPYAGLAIGDFDSDGKQEVAIGTSSDTAASILVYKWNGSQLARKSTIATSETAAFLRSHDIDRDGDDDLLFVHPNAGKLAWLLQSSRRLQGPEGISDGAYVGYDLPISDGLAAGDLDDDGCTDVFGASAWSVSTVIYGSGCERRRAPSDFDGDGTSDLLWHNSVTGASDYWRSAAFSASVRLTTVNNPQWSIAGTGDFNGDGKADVFWRNGVTGAAAIWKSGNFATQQAVTRITNPAWQVAGIGDFDGDGKDDLLWRNIQTGANAIWRSGNFATQTPMTTITNLAWQVAGIGDFDGDGKDDVLWRNAANAVNAIWRSGDYRKQMPVAAATNTAWLVAGVGDFDGDGRADLLWRDSLGNNTLWLSINSALSVRHDLPMQGTDWHVAAVGDFDGNGKDDVLWRHGITGESEYWRAALPTLARPVARVASSVWQVVK